MSGFRLAWRGAQAAAEVVAQVVIPALTDFGLVVEAGAKAELYKGHGVRTGTLRRSVHAASPGYNWGGDDGSSEMGGAPAPAQDLGNRVAVEVGSGLEYALPVHQGHGSFGGYHFLANSYEKNAGRLDGLLAKYRGNLK